jgi:hypothetical protein
MPVGHACFPNYNKLQEEFDYVAKQSSIHNAKSTGGQPYVRDAQMQLQLF